MAQGKLLIERRVHQPGNRGGGAQEELHGRDHRGQPHGPPPGGLRGGQGDRHPGVADSTIVVARSTGPGSRRSSALDRDGRNPRQLTSFGSLTTHPAVAADGRLAFVTYKGGPPQVWGQFQPNGPFQRMSTPGASGLEISGLAWSPDGERLCFVQENRKGLADIHVLDLGTGRAVQLTPGATPAGAPAGTRPAPNRLPLGPGRDPPGVHHGRRRQPGPAPHRRPRAQGLRGLETPRATGSPTWPGRDGRTTCTPWPRPGPARQKVASSPEPVESLCWSPDGRWLLLGLKGRRVAPAHGRPGREVPGPGTARRAASSPSGPRTPRAGRPARQSLRRFTRSRPAGLDPLPIGATIMSSPAISPPSSPRPSWSPRAWPAASPPRRPSPSRPRPPPRPRRRQTRPARPRRLPAHG